MPKFPILFQILFFISLALAIAPQQQVILRALAQEVHTIPTVAYSVGSQELLVPDWSQISFATLPPIQEPGFLQLPQSLVSQIGYDPTRSWNAGLSPDSFVMLGDVENAFHIEAFTLGDISGISGGNMAFLRLNDFALINWQTPESLVSAIPGLGSLSVSQVKPIQDLLAQVGGVSSHGSISDVLRQNPSLGDIPLGELDLTRYSLDSIPGLTTTRIAQFSAWQEAFIAQVPGLKQVPFSQFPQSPLGGIGMVGITDVVWSDAEHGDSQVGDEYFVSGFVNRNNANVPVACESGLDCPYIELSDLTGTSGAMHGKRWASGKQQVKGGFGPLAAVNNGREPTGRLVYGPAFKVVVTGTNESSGTADFGLYLRVCTHIPFLGKTCTPYFIGPIPWLPTREKGLIVVSAIPAH